MKKTIAIVDNGTKKVIHIENSANNMRVVLTDAGVALFESGSGNKFPSLADYVRNERGTETDFTAVKTALNAVYVKLVSALKSARMMQARGNSLDAVARDREVVQVLANFSALIGNRVNDKRVYKNALYITEPTIKLFAACVLKNEREYYTLETFVKKFIPTFWACLANIPLSEYDTKKSDSENKKKPTMKEQRDSEKKRADDASKLAETALERANMNAERANALEADNKQLLAKLNAVKKYAEKNNLPELLALIK